MPMQRRKAASREGEMKIQERHMIAAGEGPSGNGRTEWPSGPGKCFRKETGCELEKRKMCFLTTVHLKLDGEYLVHPGVSCTYSNTVPSMQ